MRFKPINSFNRWFDRTRTTAMDEFTCLLRVSCIFFVQRRNQTVRVESLCHGDTIKRWKLRYFPCQ